MIPQRCFAVPGAIQTGLQPAFLQAAIVGNLSTTFPEPSGIARPNVPANRGYIWMEQDSGGPNTFLAVNLTTMAAAGSWTLQGVSQSDFEDCTSFYRNGTAYLVMGDHGDNTSVRASIILYRMPEPTITGSDGTIGSGTIEAITCQYPAGNTPPLKDVECMFADPDTGDLYLITKRNFPALIYKLPYATSYTGTQTLTYVGKLATDTSATSLAIGTGSKVLTTVSSLAFAVGSRVRVSSRANTANFFEGEVTAQSANSLTVFVEISGTIPTIGGSGTFTDWDISLPGSYTPTGNNGCITGGSMSPHGSEICLVSYAGTMVWKRNKNASIGTALAAAPIYITGDVVSGIYYPHAIPGFPQREAVEYLENNDLVSIGEYVSTYGSVNPMVKYIRSTKPVTTVRLQNGLSGYTAAIDTFIFNTTPTADNSATASIIGDIDLLATPTAFSAVATASSGTMIDVTVASSAAYVAGVAALIATSTVGAYVGTWEVDSKPSGTVVRLKCPFVATATGTISNHTADRQILLAFTDLTAIPSNATIVDAKLRLYINTEGKGLQVHRMKTAWTAASTWNSIVNGIWPSDGTKAEPTKDAYVPGPAGVTAMDTYVGFYTLNIPVSTIQNWRSGAYTNNGWCILGDEFDLTGDGFQMDSSESATQSRKPMLIVSYVV